MFTEIKMSDQDQYTYESVCQVSVHSTVKHVKGHLAEVTNCRCTYAYIQVLNLITVISVIMPL